MKSLKALLIVAIGLSLWLGGCKVKEPGTPLADIPPSTVLSVAPTEGSTVNYYLTLSWAGNDPDGTIAGFRLYIDSTFAGFTTVRDTAIAFYTPGDSVPQAHSFSVQAVDDAGLVDPSPPVRRFFTVNRTPSATFGSVGIVNHDVVGTNFRVTVRSLSPRPSSTLYSVAVDDPNAWSPWSRDSMFAFAAPELIGDPLFPIGVTGISNAALTPGQHIIYIRAQNAGGAISNVAADTITVGTGPDYQPTMDTTTTATYGSSNFYPDGSVYYVQASGQKVTISFEATAPHKGEINAYRWRTGQIAADNSIQWSENWSPWMSKPGIDTTDLALGDYAFEFMARDLSDNMTAPDSFIVRLVRQILSDSVIIAADTRNVSSPSLRVSQSLVTSFYDSVLAAANVTKVRVVQFTVNDSMPDPSRHGMNYLSPYDVHNAGLIVWHMEDPSPGNPQAGDFTRRTRILEDYLSKGGRIIMSGWNIISKFQTASSDSVVFESGSYAVEYLKIFSGWRQTAPRVIGFDGDNGFTSVRLDTAKVPRNTQGKLNTCWTFDPQGQDIVIGRLATSDSTSNPRHHRPTAYIYNLSFRVAVFGTPLYFCQTTDVENLFYRPDDPVHSVLTIMMQGL